MLEPLGAAVPDADVVRGPHGAELGAERGQLADEFAQRTVVGLAPRFGAQQRDRGLRAGLPVDEEVLRTRVEEVVAGEVGAAVPVGGVAVAHRRVQSPGQRVGGDDVQAAVAHESGGHRHGVEQPLDGRRDLDVLAAGRRSAGGPGCSGQIEQVGAFVLVQLQRPRDRVENVLGDAADVALLKARVPLDADAGEHGDLLPAQTRNTASAAGGKPDLLRGDPAAPAGEEVPDVVAIADAVGGAVVHAFTVTTDRPGGRSSLYPP